MAEVTLIPSGGGGGGSGLEALDEGNGTGWRLVGRDPLNYGNIGLDAVDKSVSNSASATKGATGPESVAWGRDNTVSGERATAWGQDNTSSGSKATAWGGGNTAPAEYETSFGKFGTEYVPASDDTDRLLNIGMGTSDIAREDALTIYKNGAVKLNPVTNASITNEAAGMLFVDSSSGDRLKYRDSMGFNTLAYTGEISIYTVTQVSATYTILPSDSLVIATANTFTVTLPTAVGVTGKSYTIKNSGVGTLTLDGSGAEAIDGVLTQVLTQFDCIVVVSNGVGWVII